MKKPKKAAKTKGVKASNTSSSIKCFYEIVYSLLLNRFAVCLNMIMVIILVNGCLLVHAQPVLNTVGINSPEINNVPCYTKSYPPDILPFKPLTAFINETGPNAAMASIAGGVPPYTFSWNTTPLQTTPIATGLLPGQFIILTVTDAKKVSRSVNYWFDNWRWFPVEKEKTFDLSVYPNPAAGNLNMMLKDAGNTGFSYELMDMAGHNIYTSPAMLNATGLQHIDITRFAAGVYSLVVHVGNDFVVSKVIIRNP